VPSSMVAPGLVVIAGPNGSGKSSLIQKLMTMPEINLGTYINADDIELGLHDIVDPQRRSREAQRIADANRTDCLEKGKSFSFETVMSHPSKIDLMHQARQRGYGVTLLFVAVDDPLLNIERVSVRVSQGGHSVPPDRIVSRYHRTLALLPRAILASDSSVLFDNTERGSGPQSVMTATREATGFRLSLHKSGCAWLEREFLSHLPFSGLMSGQVSSVLAPEAVLRDADQRRTADLTFP
jgi:predicted ABC-type ATPase